MMMIKMVVVMMMMIEVICKLPEKPTRGFIQ